MILDTAKYAGPCDCGRVHELRTKLVVCEYGAMDKFDDYKKAIDKFYDDVIARNA